MVMKEASEPTKTFVLTRGQYDLPDPNRLVSRSIPSGVRYCARCVCSTRLGLAQWVISDDNPLLARVIVNRIWHKFFGRGIVASLDDFGVLGDYPTHPELLDQLAFEFQHSNQFGAEHAWSLSISLRESSSVRLTDNLQSSSRVVSQRPRQSIVGILSSPPIIR